MATIIQLLQPVKSVDVDFDGLIEFFRSLSAYELTLRKQSHKIYFE